MAMEFWTDLKNGALEFFLQTDPKKISEAISQNRHNLKSSKRILTGNTASGTVLDYTDLTENEFAEYDDKRAKPSL